MTDAPQGPDNLPAQPEVAPEVLEVRRGAFGVHGTGDTSGFGRLVRKVVAPVSSERPYGGYFDEIADRVQAVVPAFSEGVERVVVDRGELTIVVRREHLLSLLQALRDDPLLRFEMCMGATAVHYPTDAGRELHVVYPLLSITHNRRVRVETTCPDADPHVPSSFSVYPTNDWHEREAWDLMGVIFDGHPGLARIMMPDDWPGHPQRKDYPLGGVSVTYHGAEIPPPDQRRVYS